MATLKTTAPLHWVSANHDQTASASLWSKFLAFADSQNERKTMWFFLALVVQGIFFLPLPAFLVYYFDAPILLLVVTMTCFFATIISYMGGAGIRTVLLLSAASILVQVAMAIAVML
jgi:hypothetical protein